MHPKTLLHQLNLANQLTFLRLIAIPFFIIAVLDSRFILALGLFVGAAVTDVLDGVIARYLRQRTPLGAYLDPAADKLLLTSAFVLLTDYPSMFRAIELGQRIPVWLTILTISRDVFIVCVALVLYLTLEVKGFPPSVLGKLTALAEFTTVSLFLLCAAVTGCGPILDGMVWITLALTLASGFHYVNRTIRMLVSGKADFAPS